MSESIASGPLLLQLVRAAHQLEAALTKELDSLSITPELWRLLSALADGGGLTMTELSRSTVLPAATATRLVDKLVVRGMVYRRADPIDKRRVIVFLSSQGRRSITRALDAQSAAENSAAHLIGSRGYAALLDALTKLDEFTVNHADALA